MLVGLLPLPSWPTLTVVTLFQVWLPLWKERVYIPWTAPLPSTFTRRAAGYQCYKSEVMLGDLFNGLVRHSNHHRACTVGQVLQCQFADGRHRAGAQRVSLLPVGDLAGEGSAQWPNWGTCGSLCLWEWGAWCWRILTRVMTPSCTAVSAGSRPP